VLQEGRKTSRMRKTVMEEESTVAVASMNDMWKAAADY